MGLAGKMRPRDVTDVSRLGLTPRQMRQGIELAPDVPVSLRPVIPRTQQPLVSVSGILSPRLQELPWDRAHRRAAQRDFAKHL